MKYKVTFLDYWHLSSGLSAGAKFDSSVVKDSDGLPYISGKTIKGLLREVAKDENNFINECFGKKIEEGNEEEQNQKGACYFSNAILDEETTKEIIEQNLQGNFYDIIASTKIDANGIAAEHSLREIEVVVPIALYGEILDIPDNYKENMRASLKKIKRMGLNRNRGLGRCKIEVLGDEKWKSKILK